MARWHTCNVLHEAGNRHVWQFSAADGGYKLERQQTCLPSEALPKGVVKSWGALVNRKLNIAWLPPGQAFLRALHLPATDFAETLSMVEFQLEKLSPLPVAQIVWAVEKLPQSAEGEQTLVVLIAARNHVEAFLGQLEGEGYMADRLEVPMLDQILATEIQGDGAWLYPVQEGAATTWVTAWWYGGVLRHLDLQHVPEGEQRAALLKDHLRQTVWAGELEGWLSAPPRWRLVADPRTAAIWDPVIRELTGEAVEVVLPLPVERLAALTAGRAAQAGGRSTLLPTEFADRYRQQFIDRLWMGGLGAIIMVYLVGVMVYLGALEVVKFQYKRAEGRAASMSGAYTNALQLKAQIQVLQDQLNLKNAVLDGWLAVVHPLPEELAFNSLSFSRGRMVGIFGSAAPDQNAKITEYNGALRKLETEGQPIFKSVDPPTMSGGPGGKITWSFKCELNRADLE